MTGNHSHCSTRNTEQRVEVQRIQRDLARRLNEQGWTQERTAAALGVARQRVTDWLMHNAESGNPHTDNRIKLSKAAKAEAVASEHPPPHRAVPLPCMSRNPGDIQRAGGYESWNPAVTTLDR